MAQYRTVSQETLSYLKKKSWIPQDIQPPRIVEDKINVGSGASVSNTTGAFKVQTTDKASQVYLPFNTKNITIHELTHVVDFQKNGTSNNPLSEGLAYYIEQKAYKEGDFYKTDAEKLSALKGQIIRNARVIKTFELQNKQITPEAANTYFVQELGMSERAAASEVKMMTSEESYDHLQKISYVAGSEGIATLWDKVQAKYKKMSYSQFLEKLYNQNGDEGTDGRITTIAKKAFGINMR